MMDINDIKAGDYLLLTEFWDEYTSKPGEAFDFIRHRRGEIVTLSREEARRLYLAGAVVPHDADNPTHVVNADGTVTRVTPAEPTGMSVDELGGLAQQLQLPPDATPADVAKGVQALQDLLRAAEQSKTEAEEKAANAAKVAAAAQAAQSQGGQAQSPAPPAATGRGKGGGR